MLPDSCLCSPPRSSLLCGGYLSFPVYCSLTPCFVRHVSFTYFVGEICPGASPSLLYSFPVRRRTGKKKISQQQQQRQRQLVMGVRMWRLLYRVQRGVVRWATLSLSPHPFFFFCPVFGKTAELTDTGWSSSLGHCSTPAKDNPPPPLPEYSDPTQLPSTPLPSPRVFRVAVGSALRNTRVASNILLWTRRGKGKGRGRRRKKKGAKKMCEAWKKSKILPKKREGTECSTYPLSLSLSVSRALPPPSRNFLPPPLPSRFAPTLAASEGARPTRVHTTRTLDLFVFSFEDTPPPAYPSALHTQRRGQETGEGGGGRKCHNVSSLCPCFPFDQPPVRSRKEAPTEKVCRGRRWAVAVGCGVCVCVCVIFAPTDPPSSPFHPTSFHPLSRLMYNLS